jgi:truncated hemoglobin YjbI
MSYETAIREDAALLGVPGINPAHIEAWMRVEHGTLDALSPAQFRDEVLVAVACARASTSAENDALAASYGLTPRS